MARVAPEPSRVTVRREGSRLIATIAVRRNWLAAAFFTVWLGGWAMGEGLVSWQLFTGTAPLGARAFMGFWLAAWTVGGIMAMRQVAWTVVGREEIAVDGRSLRVSWAAGPFGRTREYEVASIRNVREDTTLAGALARGFRMTSPGRHGAIAFDYGAKTVRLGVDLEGEDVQKVLALVREQASGAAARW
jgi:hypothetical protein